MKNLITEAKIRSDLFLTIYNVVVKCIAVKRVNPWRNLSCRPTVLGHNNQIIQLEIRNL